MEYIEVLLKLFLLIWTQDLSHGYTTTPSVPTGRISLIGGTSSYGYVVANSYGRAYKVCADSYWDDNDAKVACRVLGYSYGVAVKNVQLDGGYYYYYYIMYQLRCTGTETSLFSCRYSYGYRYSSYNSYCSSGSAMVSCSEKSFNTSFSAVIKINTTRTAKDFGRVYVEYLGLKLQPCFSGWSDSVSKQLCIKQGFKTGVTIGTFDQSPDLPIWLQKINCTGSQSTSCLTGGTSLISCGDNRKVSVICSNTATDFAVRLAGGSTKKEGRVEIRYKGKWGTVCDKTWDAASAVVVCKHLGYQAGVPKFDAYGSSEGTIIVNEINCDGNETNIFQCKSRGWEDERNMKNCPAQYKSAGVQCEPPVKLADNAIDAGNVEVSQTTSWSLVCGRNWGYPEALVTCKQLGYQNGIPICCNSFGSPTYYTYLPLYQCSGNETALASCTMRYIGCYVDGYASVHCFNGPTKITHVSLRGGKQIRGRYISGTVLVTQNRMVGRICSDSMDDKAANVTCKQLGYKGGVSYLHPDNRDTKPVFLIRVSCTGLEDNLDNCSIDKAISVDSCNSAGVLCYNKTEGSVDVTIEKGSRGVGVVFVSHDGEKGYICNNKWDDDDAQVLCHQLGYHSGKSGRGIITNIYAEPFGSGFRCTGDEETIFQCPSDGWNSDTTEGYCSPSNAATVMCFKDVRLSNALLKDGMVYGNVELYHNGSWLNVCPDTFDKVAAGFVCNKLGYPNSKMFYSLGARYYGSDGLSIKCDSSAASFADCKLSYCTARFTHLLALMCSSKNVSGVYTPKVSGTGELTIYHNGLPGVICNSDWDTSSAMVVCKQLGFRTGVATRPYFTARNQSTPYWMMTARCRGTETQISDCKIEETTCSRNSPAVGVYCTNGTGVRYRLNGSKRSGRVEIYLRGAWRAVCANQWYTAEANVFCRQMGFVKGLYSYQYTYSYGSQVGISRIDCNGHEETLLECRASIVNGYHSCRRIAKVTCLGDVTLSRYSSSTKNMGPVYYLDKTLNRTSYGYVCDTGFDDRAAEVVCRYLYFTGGKHIGPSSFGTPYARLNYLISNVKCSGNENSLKDCYKTEARSYACPGYASVICYNSTPSTGVSFRISSYSYVGDVMVTHLGRTGYICDDGWDDNAAKVICRQLRGSRTTVTAKAIQSRNSLVSSSLNSAYPVWFSNVSCRGDENRLQDCTHPGLGNGASCTYMNRRAAVVCSSEDIKYRITGYNSKIQGRAEISINGLWGGLCLGSYNYNSEANIFCKLMGFKGGEYYGRYGYYRRRIWANYLRCTGKEKSIFDCAATWISGSYYYSCYRPLMVRCFNAARLDGKNDGMGPLQLYHRNSWFTVAETGFTRQMAKLSCKNISNDYVDGILLGDSGVQTNPRVGDFFIQLNCSSSATKLSQCTLHLTKKSFGGSDQLKPAVLFCSNVTLPDTQTVSRTYIKNSYSGTYYGSLTADLGQIEGSICPVNWGKSEATVFCKSFRGNRPYGIPYRSISQNSVVYPFVMGNVKCNGTEESLSQCSYSTLGAAMGCNITTGPAGVFCSPNAIRFKAFALDVKNNAYELKVYFSQRWTRVCNINDQTARLICREQGFQNGYIAKSNRYRYERVYLRQLLCDGWEADISQCRMYWYTYSSSYYYCSSIRCSKSVRLLNSRSVDWFGEVLLSMNGTWKSFCRKDWTQKNSEVVCKELGYSKGHKMCCGFSSYRSRYITTGFKCNGKETALEKCPRLPGPARCSRNDYATVFCADGDVTNYRLTNSFRSYYHYRLRISYSSFNGRVCPDGWTKQDARVACREFGFSNGEMYTHLEYSSSDPYLLGNPGCSGDERRIRDCPKGALGNVPHCSGRHSAGVLCFTSSGVEASLKGGTNNAGYVEVRWNGRRYALCNSYFYNDEANVLCRELGFSYGTTDRYGRYSVPYSRIRIQFDCKGNETALRLCPRRNIYTSSYCTAVSVRCFHRVRVYPDMSQGSTTSSSRMGPIQVYQNGEWMYVSSANFTNDAAVTACRSMGYQYGIALCCSAFGNMSLSSDNHIASCAPEDLQKNKNCSVLADGTDDDYVSVICSKTLQSREIRWIPTGSTGYVEVKVMGQWGRICTDSWNDTDANVFCKSKNYVSGIAYKHVHGYYNYPSRRRFPAIIGDVRCKGNEKSILDCSYKVQPDAGKCDSKESAGVTCFKNTTDHRIEYRISGEDSSGVVQVKVKGVWGAVCRSSFDDAAANVFCRTKQWYGGEAIYLPYTRRNFTGPVWFSAFRCKGNEKSLYKCPHTGLGWSTYRYCSDLATVYCYSKKVRLEGRGGKPFGRVLVYKDGTGTWDYVCGEGWTETNSAVVCKMLGYSYGKSLPYTSMPYSYKSDNNRKVTLKGVRCEASSRSLLDCKQASKWDNSCRKRSYASVYCSNITFNSDVKVMELKPAYVQRNSSVKAYVGSVIVSVYGVKSLICDRKDWSSAAANVTCKELGFKGGVSFRGRASYLMANSPYLLSSVQCTGDEKRLSDCKASKFAHIDGQCQSTGVLCYKKSGISYELNFGTTSQKGLLEISYDGEKKGVCHRNMIRYFYGNYGLNKLGAVACRSVGYKDGFLHLYTRGYKHWLDYVYCDGHEDTVLDCSSRGWVVSDSTSCYSGGETFVECFNNEIGVAHVKLSSSSGSSLANLAYAHMTGLKRTLPIASHCQDQNNDATRAVVCRHLGYPKAESCGQHQSSDTNSRIMVFLRCQGNETTLSSCSFVVMQEIYHCGILCVQCSGKPSSPVPPPSTSTAPPSTETPAHTTSGKTTTPPVVIPTSPSKNTSPTPDVKTSTTIPSTTEGYETKTSTIITSPAVIIDQQLKSKMTTVIIGSTVPAVFIVIVSIVVVAVIFVKFRRRASASDARGIVNSTYDDVDRLQLETPMDAAHVQSDLTRSQVSNPLYDVIPAAEAANINVQMS